MVAHFLKGQLDANKEDVLEFLERDVRYIPSPSPDPRHDASTGRQMQFSGRRQGNVVSIYRDSWDTGRPEAEVISFQVVQHTKGTTIVTASCAGDHPYVVLILHRIWTRLAIAFGAYFAAQALTDLRELQYRAS